MNCIIKQRQLKKSNLSFESFNAATEDWNSFLTMVSKSYFDSDQERYLNERAVDISSKELLNLNRMLENAQHIAQLGYWIHNTETNNTVWSKEIINIFFISEKNITPSFKDLIKRVHPDDRDHFESRIKQSLVQCDDIEIESRIKNNKDAYNWYRTIIKSNRKEKTVSGIILDIDKSKKAEEKINRLSEKLVSTARSAGMTEVATSILHNVGNVLNSSNVSITLLKDSFLDNDMKKFFYIIDMLNQHKDSLADFFSQDTKGKIIPRYLNEKSKKIIQTYNNNKGEINNLYNDLQHIKNIVNMQNPINKVSCMFQPVDLIASIKEAIKVNKKSIEANNINIVESYQENFSIESDKSKLFQILTNLIQNAKDSILMRSSDDKRLINIVVSKKTNDLINIMISDSGIGIENKNIDKIFSFGFTTKNNGHGFGLHCSALFAQEMGGKLKVHSQGKNKGASFILRLPKNHTKQNNRILNE